MDEEEIREEIKLVCFIFYGGVSIAILIISLIEFYNKYF